MNKPKNSKNSFCILKLVFFMENSEPGLHLSSMDFKALSAENRIRILKALKQRNCNPTELSSRLRISIPSVQKHLDKLVESGLVMRIEDHRKWAYYKLTPKGTALLEPGKTRFVLLLAAGIILTIGIFALWNAWPELNKPQIVLHPPVFDSETASVALSWSTNLSPETSRFDVQRKTVLQKEFRTIQTGLQATAFNDKNIQANARYEYRIVIQADGATQPEIRTASNSGFVSIPETFVHPENPSGQPGATQQPTEPSAAEPPPASALPDQTPDASAPNNPPDSGTKPFFVQAYSIPAATTHWTQTIETNDTWTELELEKTPHPAVLLAWSFNGTAETTFEIQYKIQGTDWQTLATGILENFFLDALAETGELREYRIRARQEGKPGDYSETITVPIP